MPSLEFADVCTVSLKKMSSLSFSGVVTLLRITLALPLSVATLPIGSSAGACVGAAVAGSGAAGAAGVCACARCVRPPVVSSAASGFWSISKGNGIAERLGAPPSTRQPSSGSTNESRNVTMGSRGGEGRRRGDNKYDSFRALGKPVAERPLNAAFGFAAARDAAGPQTGLPYFDGAGL